MDIVDKILIAVFGLGSVLLAAIVVIESQPWGPFYTVPLILAMLGL